MELVKSETYQQLCHRKIRDAANDLRAALDERRELTKNFWESWVEDQTISLEDYQTQKSKMEGMIEALAIGLCINVEVYLDE